MEETRWWTRLLLVSAIIAVFLLLGGPLSYKFGISPLQPAFLSLLLALIGGAIVLVASLVMVVVAQRAGLAGNRNQLLVTIVLSVIPIVVMVPQMMKGSNVPPIHDITTDTVNPPKYFKVANYRVDAANSLEYGAGFDSPEELAALQHKAYPAVKPLMTEMSVADAVKRAGTVLREQGLDVVNIDPDRGIVEAVATTFWFGFKDDVVVRVTPNDSGSVVDVRSVSRVGQSDLGVNAARIEKFLASF